MQQDHQEQQDPLEAALQALLEVQVQLAMVDRLARPDQPAPPVRKVLMERREQLVYLVLMALRGQQDRREAPGVRASLVLQDGQVPLGQPELLQTLQDLPDRLERVARAAQRDPQARQELVEQVARLGQRDPQARQELLARVALGVQQDQQARAARQVPGVERQAQPE